MCKDCSIIENISVVCHDTTRVVHTKCIEILCNLTRFQGNIGALFSSVQVSDALFICGSSPVGEDRLWTMRSLQNMTADSSCKSRLATSSIIKMLCVSATKLEDADEHEAAVASLANLSTDASAVVQMANSKICVSTLISIANDDKYSSKVQFHACNSIARIAVWFQKFAGLAEVTNAFNLPAIPTFEPKGHMRWDYNE